MGCNCFVATILMQSVCVEAVCAIGMLMLPSCWPVCTETCRSVVIDEIIVHLMVIVPKKKCNFHMCEKNYL